MTLEMILETPSITLEQMMKLYAQGQRRISGCPKKVATVSTRERDQRSSAEPTDYWDKGEDDED